LHRFSYALTALSGSEHLDTDETEPKQRHTVELVNTQTWLVQALQRIESKGGSCLGIEMAGRNLLRSRRITLRRRHIGSSG